MSTKHAVDQSGRYLGAFIDAPLPAGAVEIDVLPADGRMRLVNGKWVLELPYEQARSEEYAKQGITADAMIVAMWEKLVENRPESADAIQAKRAEVKLKHPKP